MASTTRSAPCTAAASVGATAKPAALAAAAVDGIDVETDRPRRRSWRTACSSEPPIRPRPRTATRRKRRALTRVHGVALRIGPRCERVRGIASPLSAAGRVRARIDTPSHVSREVVGTQSRSGGSPWPRTATARNGAWSHSPRRCSMTWASCVGAAVDPPEGGPFVVACVEEEFFVIARQEGRRSLCCCPT